MTRVPGLDALHFLRKFSSTGANNNVGSTVNLARHLVPICYARTLREYCLIARSKCHRSALVRNTHLIYHGRYYPLPTCSAGYSPLPFCCLFRPLFLNSWTIFFINTTTNNKPVKMIGSMTLFRILIATIPLVLCLLPPLVQHFVRRSMSPAESYHRHKHNVHSLFRYEGSDADKLPAIGSSGGLCSTTFSHRLFIDKFWALQNGPPNGSLQILTLTTLHNDLVPSRAPFRPASSPTSHFYLIDNGMAT